MENVGVCLCNITLIISNDNGELAEVLTFSSFPLSLRTDEVEDADLDAADRNRTDVKINRMVLLATNKV